MSKPIGMFSVIAAFLLASFAAQAADTTELKVKGVIKPSACTPSFTGGGVVDYGTIPAKSLAAGTYTRLGTKSLAFAITCDAATKMALKFTDNRNSSVVTGIVSASVPDAWVYGLGTVAGKNVGGYMLHFPQNGALTDGATANRIFSTDGSKTWTSTDGSGMLGKDRLLSWAAPGMNVPAAFKTISGDIQVSAVLNKPENLPLTQDVPLDGSATIEVLYL